MQKTSAPGNRDRRRFYRIDDEVCLALGPVEAEEADKRLADFWQNDHAFSIRNDYNFQIEQHIADFHMIENRMPELARYLGVLEKQIDRITQKLIDDDSDDRLERRMVNLSAQGMSLYHGDKLNTDSLVEIDLKLLPSGQRIVIMARVVMVGSDADPEHGGYKISLDFEHLHEADREILVKHIHGRQMEALSGARKD